MVDHDAGGLELGRFPAAIVRGQSTTPSRRGRVPSRVGGAEQPVLTAHHCSNPGRDIARPYAASASSRRAPPPASHVPRGREIGDRSGIEAARAPRADVLVRGAPGTLIGCRDSAAYWRAGEQGQAGRQLSRGAKGPWAARSETRPPRAAPLLAVKGAERASGKRQERDAVRLAGPRATASGGFATGDSVPPAPRREQVLRRPHDRGCAGPGGRSPADRRLDGWLEARDVRTRTVALQLDHPVEEPRRNATPPVAVDPSAGWTTGKLVRAGGGSRRSLLGRRGAQSLGAEVRRPRLSGSGGPQSLSRINHRSRGIGMQRLGDHAVGERAGRSTTRCRSG